MNDFFEGWVKSDASRRDSIDLKRIYIDINEGNFYDAVLFSQIMYWHEPSKDGKQRLQVFRDGHWWLAKSYGDWQEECRINASTSRKSIDRLRQRGLVVTEIYHFAGKPMVHIRIDKAGFEKAVKNSAKPKVELMCPTVSDTNDTTGQMDMIPQDDCLYTETTTETTTDKKEKELTASFDAQAISQADKPTLKLLDKPKRQKKQAHPLFKDMQAAIQTAFRWETPTATEWGILGKAANSLLDANITLEQLPSLVGFCRGQWRDKLRPHHLSSNVSEWRKTQPKPPPVIEIDPTAETAFATLEEQQAAMKAHYDTIGANFGKYNDKRPA